MAENAERHRLFYESPDIVNEDLDRLVGPIIGEFVLRQTTRAGEDEHPEFIRSQWNHIPLPVRPNQSHEQWNEVEIFASDALAALTLNLGADSPIVHYWENLTKHTGLGETFGFDLDQGELTISDNASLKLSPHV